MQVDFLINRLNALEEHMKAVEEQMALELDHRQAFTRGRTIMPGSYASCGNTCLTTARLTPHVLNCRLVHMYWEIH